MDFYSFKMYKTKSKAISPELLMWPTEDCVRPAALCSERKTIQCMLSKEKYKSSQDRLLFYSPISQITNQKSASRGFTICPETLDSSRTPSKNETDLETMCELSRYGTFSGSHLQPVSTCASGKSNIWLFEQVDTALVISDPVGWSLSGVL